MLNTASLDATAGGLINLNDGLVTTSGAQTYNGATQLGADNTLNGSAIMFNGAVNGAHSLTTASTSDTAFNGAVDIASLDATAGGLIDLNAGTIVTSGDQVYHTAVNLTGDDALTGNSITFLSSIGGAHALTTDSTLDTTFDGAVNIGALNATAGGLINLNEGLVTTSGAQTYNGAVQLGAANTLTGSAITVNGAINGAYALTTNSTNDTAFNGAIAIASLDATAGGLIDLNAGAIVTSGDQIYHTAVALTGADSLTGNSLSFMSSVSGANSLTTDSTLDTTFGGAVNIGSLGATAGGLIDLNNGLVTTSGAQVYHTAVQLGADNALTGSAITFDGAVNGAYALNANATNDTTFNGVLNTASLDATAGGRINLNDGLVTTSGAQTYNGATQLGADNTLNGSAITFNGSINGSYALTTNSTNDTAFNGAIDIGSLDATAGGLIDLNAGTIVTSGAQNYHTAVALTGDDSLTGAAITFDGSITGAHGLTTNSTADTAFDGVVNIGSLDATAGGLIDLNDGLVMTAGAQTYRSAVSAPGAMDLTAGGLINLNGGSVVSVGAQTYDGATQLGADGTLTGSAITFNGAINGAHGLTTNSTNDTAFNGAVNIRSLDATAANIDLNAGTIVTSGDQVYRSPVTLVSDESLTSTLGNISFLSSVGGAKALTTDSALDTTFDGVLNTASLDATAGGLINLNDGLVTTSGAQTYNGATQLGADNALNASAITFNGSIGGAHTLTTTSANDTTFNGAVNIASLDATAANIDLNAGTIATSGGQVYHSAVTLTGDDSLTGSAITFDAAISGAHALTTNSTADTAFGGVVNIGALDATAGGLIDLNDGVVTTAGAQTYRSAMYAPGAMDLTAGGLIGLDGGSVVSVGAQTYNGATLLGADSTLSGSAITFNGAIGGAHSLTTASTNDTAFNGAVNIASLDATAANIDLNAGTIATSGGQVYHSAVVLTGDDSLTGSAITFDAAISGAHALTTHSTADTAFDGVVNIGSLDATAGGLIDLNNGLVTTAGAQTYRSAVSAPGAIDLTAGGLINLNGGSVVSVGAQTYDGATQLGADDTLTASAITFNGAIGGAHALTTDSTNDTAFNGILNIGSLDATAGGNILLNGGAVTTNGAQSYHSAVLLGADTTLNSNGGTVKFDTTVDGAQTLTINAAAGDVDFLGAVGQGTHLTGLAITGTGTTDINGGFVTTNGAQSYGEKVVLSADGWLASNGGNIDFLKTVDGTVSQQQGLTVDGGAGAITFYGDIGSFVALKYLTLLGTGAKNLYGTVYTGGDQIYTNDLFLFADLILHTSGGNVLFMKTVNGGHLLGIDAGTGNITFDGLVGNTVPLSGLNLTGTGTTSLNGGAVTTTGAQNYGEKVALGVDDTLTSLSGGITFGSTINGAHSLTVASGAGDITFDGAVGDQTALTGLALSGSGATNLNGGVVNTNGDQTYGENVALGGNNVLASNGGQVSFDAAVDGAHDLTVNAGAGNINFYGAVGSASPLNSLTLNGSGTTDLNGGVVNSNGNQIYNEKVSLSANDVLTSNGGAVTFAGTVNGGYDLTVISGAGTISLNGAVGDSAHLTSLTLNGSVADLNGGVVNTDGAQTYAANAVLGADTVLSSNGGAIDFAGTVNGAHSLTVNAGAGSITLGGAVGDTTHLNSLTLNGSGTTAVNGGAVTTTGAQSYGESVVLGADTTFTANGGAATFAGSVTGPHALTILTGLGAITLDGPATVGAIDLEGGRVSWNDTLSGTGAKIFGGDIMMNGDVDTSGVNGVLMVAGHSFQNVGAKAIDPTGSRWLIYSVDPTLDIKGGLTGAVQWSTDYLLGPLPSFLGNGFLYKNAAPVPPNPTLGDFNPGANGTPGVNQNGDNTHAGVISDGSDTNGGTSSNWSASTGDLFNWDTGSLNDALNDNAPGDDSSDPSSDPKKKKQPKK